jgi:hypothetical protein
MNKPVTQYIINNCAKSHGIIAWSGTSDIGVLWVRELNNIYVPLTFNGQLITKIWVVKYV